MRQSVIMAFFILVVVAAILSIETLFVMLMWNALANYFGFKTITFGIAFVVTLILSTIIGALKGNKNKK